MVLAWTQVITEEGLLQAAESLQVVICHPVNVAPGAWDVLGWTTQLYRSPPLCAVRADLHCCLQGSGSDEVEMEDAGSQSLHPPCIPQTLRICTSMRRFAGRFLLAA